MCGCSKMRWDQIASGSQPTAMTCMAICLRRACCAKAATKRAGYIPAALVCLRPTHKMRWLPRCTIWLRPLAVNCRDLDFDFGRSGRVGHIALADRLDDLCHELIDLLWRAANEMLRI